MYFTKGKDREYEALMQVVPGFERSRGKENSKQKKQHNSKGKARKKAKKKPKPPPPHRERNPALEKERDCPHCLYWKGRRIGCIHEVCPVFPE